MEEVVGVGAITIGNSRKTWRQLHLIAINLKVKLDRSMMSDNGMVRCDWTSLSVTVGCGYLQLVCL